MNAAWEQKTKGAGAPLALFISFAPEDPPLSATFMNSTRRKAAMVDEIAEAVKLNN